MQQNFLSKNNNYNSKTNLSTNSNNTNKDNVLIQSNKYYSLYHNETDDSHIFISNDESFKFDQILGYYNNYTGCNNDFPILIYTINSTTLNLELGQYISNCPELFISFNTLISDKILYLV